MASAAAFPSVDTGAMTSAAAALKSVASSMSDHGTNVYALQQAVAGSEDWKGQGASEWQAVMTGRVNDANLTNETLSKAGALLDQLATNLEAEQKYYNTVSGEMQAKGNSFGFTRFIPAPVGWQDPYISDMNASVTRANNLLKSFGDDCLAMAALADDITATTAANRTPGEPAGPASASGGGQLSILAMLFGSVTGNQSSGAAFERLVLSELGLSKNTTTFNQIPFLRGTIPDAIKLSGGSGTGYVVEIKGYSSQLSARFQIRLQSLLARTTGEPYWIVVKAGTNVTDQTVKLAEGTGRGWVQEPNGQEVWQGGGVIVRQPGGNYTDLNGNPITVSRDGSVDVNSYQPTTVQGTTSGGGTVAGSPGTTDPQAPSAPVNPANTTGEVPTGAGAGDPVEPGVGGGDPEVDPFIDPIP